jgi:hypothetical protein
MCCFKIFFALKPSARIKINFKNYSQHVSVPLDHHQGARRSYPIVTTDRLLVRYSVVLLQLVSLVGFIIRRNSVEYLYIIDMINVQKVDALILLASCMTYTVAVCAVKNF